MVMEQVTRPKGFSNENTLWRHKQNGTMDEFHRRFAEAVAAARKEFGKTYWNLVGGRRVPSGSGRTFMSTNPADTREVLGTFQESDSKDVEAAVAAAKEAYAVWSKRPWKERVEVFRQAAQLLVKRKYEFAAWMTLENGKNRTESANDVDEAIDFLRYYPHVYDGNHGFDRRMGSPVPQEECRSILKPYGVWGVIPPFNFPVAITVGMTTGPTLVGNTAVVKPASDTPLVAYKFVELLQEARAPPGVVNLVTGPGSIAGNALTDHPDVAGVLFTGSKPVGLSIHKRMTERNKPMIAEMGGKNAIIVSDKADLEKAVEGVGRAAFGFSGQKCSACSRVYVHEKVKDEFTKRLVEWTRANATIGPGELEKTLISPVINKKAFGNYQEYVKRAKDGGKVLIGGQTANSGPLASGWFVEATIVDGLADDHWLTTNELFVPIVSLYSYKELDEAIRRVNGVEFGLTGGIFSEDPKEVQHYFDHIEAGVVYANRRSGGSTAAVVGGQAFGGWKNSGTSGKGAGGLYYLQQFLREQGQTIVRE